MSTPVYDRWGVRVFEGDCLDVLRDLPASSVSSIVTDPPSGIHFMSKSWDADRGGRDRWVEWLTERMEQAYRVLKPGGHALVWAMPRTSHWTAWALEDAGFEVRDCIVHLFGAGFPKSLDVGKAVDAHAQGQMRRAKLLHFATDRGIDGRWLQDQGVADARSFTDWTAENHAPSDRNWALIRGALGVTAEEEAAFEREVIGTKRVIPGVAFTTTGPSEVDVTAPATDAARQWEGWGTALKPSAEHWWLVRKPFSGTVAANVLEHGTGALNVDACRIPSDGSHKRLGAITKRTTVSGDERTGAALGMYGAGASFEATNHDGGRWPPNAVLTHAALLDPETGEVLGDACAAGCVPGCPVAELDAQSGTTSSWMAKTNYTVAPTNQVYGRYSAQPVGPQNQYGDSGGASRFFPVFRWEAKAPTHERPRVNGRAHPTVKPVGLMRWLVRLVTPSGGTVLDLFAGTGTTGQAARAEGFPAILIESDPASIPLIKARLDALPKTEAIAEPAAPDDGPVDLFGLIDGAAS